jgi:hypothetical protein
MNNGVIMRVRRTAWRGALVLPLFLGMATSALAQGVAMVTDLQGKATIASADGRPRDVTILAELAAGSQVQLGAGATLVALYLDAGDEYVFKGPAAIVFKPAVPEVTSGAKPEKRGSALGAGGKGVRIKPVGVAQGAMVMRGFRTGARIQLLNLSKTRTLETQPEFRWQEVQAGLKYQFELADDTGRTVYEAQVESTAFKLPASVALKDGVPYTWEVSARLADGKKYSSSADFAVAPADLRTQATALRPAASAPLSSRIAYAAWLDQMELKDEARKYWKTAAAERPEDPRLKALATE